MNMSPHEQYWYGLICQCMESGMAVKRWCMENNISTSMFYHHVRKLKAKSCGIPAGRKGRKPEERQDIVAVQIIDDLAAAERPQGSGDPQYEEKTGKYGQGMASMQVSGCIAFRVAFPGGTIIDISNNANPAVLRSLVACLQGGC